MIKNIKNLFDQQGFVRIKNVLNFRDDLKPVINDIEFIMNRVMHNFLTSQKKKKIQNYDFKKKYTYLSKHKIPELDQFFNIRLPQNNINTNSDFFASQSLFNLITNKKILKKISKILGCEISSNPCQNSRIKQPEKFLKKDFNNGLVGKTPWHQDAGVLNIKGQKYTDLITCWIPLTKTTVANGCMLAVEKSHNLGLVNHHTGNNGQVEIKGKEAIDKMSTVPLEANVGDIILLNKHLIHCSLPNKSNNFRISIDLRYNKSNQPSGREPLPSFIVSSKNQKKIKVKNYKQWIALWEKAKHKCLQRKWSYKYQLPTFKGKKRDLPNIV